MLRELDIDSLHDHLASLSVENKKHNDNLQGLLSQFHNLLSNYSSLKSDYEEVKEGREKYKRQARGQERNPFVLVLVDGDGYLFKERFLEAGSEGGIDAARELSDSVKELMHSTMGLQADNCHVMVRVYANMLGLSKALARADIVGNEARSISPFASGFNRAEGLFDFVDAGDKKEGSDFKIRGRHSCHKSKEALRPEPMEIEKEFQSLHLKASGSISSVYQVDPGIVVKVPKNDDFARQQFCKELKIYKILSRQAACAFIVQCFYHTKEGIFLEYIEDGSLASRIQDNHTFDRNTGVVTNVNRLEPLHIRLSWTNDLTQTIAFLEKLQLAHGDLPPENVLLNRNRVELTDFDNAAEFGTPFTACQEPWGRELQENEPEYDIPGCTAGLLGPRTEQFALGSIYHYINYGMEAFGDKRLSDRPRDRGPALRDLLQDRQFPILDRHLMIDELIRKCWDNQFLTIANLAMSTKALFSKCSNGEESKTISEGMNSTLETDRGSSCVHSPINMTTDCRSMTVSPKKALCQRSERNGLFGSLRSMASY